MSVLTAITGTAILKTASSKSAEPMINWLGLDIYLPGLALWSLFVGGTVTVLIGANIIGGKP